MNNIERVTESNERGKNVQIVVKFMRHGERDLAGNLQDYGREITKQKAREKADEFKDFHAVKAVGSNAGPSIFVEDANMHMQRSLETAHIYAKEIAGDTAFKTRALGVLSYETVKSPTPYDHNAIYNSFIPENFSNLIPEAKVLVSKSANQKTIDHLLSLTSPEAESYKKEIAGSFAFVINKYVRMAQRLNPGSKVLIPAGSHGGTMELLLQEAMVRDINGNKVIGFEKLDDIGGDFDPSEAFNVKIATDEKGQSKDLILTFDHSKRPQGEITLDIAKLKELSSYYEKIHSSNA